jgi:hypothetical protein
MSREELAKLRKEVLRTLDEIPRGTNACLAAAERGLALAPGDPFFSWAALTQLHWFVRRNLSPFIKDHDWIAREDGEKKLAQRLAESFAVLARDDDRSSDRRMLLRMANLLAGLRKVVERPSAELLAEAAAHCATYERTREDDYESFEEEIGLGDFFRALRARVRAWDNAAKSERRPEDSSFVAELLELRYEATAPEREMPKIVVGRLLAVLLVGASDTLTAAADAFALSESRIVRPRMFVV